MTLSSGPESEVLLIGGCAGVGKTSVATELHVQLSRARVEHAVIEGDYLDLAWPVPHERGLTLAEENLASVRRHYRAAGYSRLIYTNTVSVRSDIVARLLAAIGGTPVVHGVLLTATRAAIIDRLVVREHGTALEEHLDRSALAAAELLGSAPPWVHRVDTSDCTVEEIARQIIAQLGWTPS